MVKYLQLDENTYSTYENGKRYSLQAVSKEND